jgi:hypothetical protein
VARLAEKVQTLLLSSDECVRAWTDRNRESLGVVDLVPELAPDVPGR